jgi:hypothetical protein
MVRIIPLYISLLMFGGCSTLSSEERQAFSQAIMVLGTHRVPNETFDESSQRFLRRIHGKTVSQIISEANNIEQTTHVAATNEI